MGVQIPDFAEVIKAQKRLRGITKVTSVERSKSFSDIIGCNIFLKLENLQSTGSFKIRGAYNKISMLSESERQAGVVCASAGNHAQGVAYSATKLGVKSTIFMPLSTPPLKVIATKAYGANVMLSGNSYDDAYEAAKVYAEENKATYIHAFNDPYIIAGQGTIGLEILDQLEGVEAILVPVGGGGLISGIAIAVKNIKPEIKVIGIEADGAQSMHESLAKGELVNLTSSGTIADGIAVKKPGDITLATAQKYVDDVIVVNDSEIAHALYLLLQRAKVLAEPSGVVGLAALMSGKLSLPGKNVVSVISGGNINMGLLEQIIEKGMMDEGLRNRLQVLIPDRSGELKKVISILESSRVNIYDIVHERSVIQVPVGYVQVTITFNAQEYGQLEKICSQLKENGMQYNVIQ